MRIILEKPKCIGCGSCSSLCPKFFELAEDGRCHLKEGKFNPKSETEELEVENLKCAQEAVEACPVQAIKIYD
ncbi:MAG: ferredoxin [Patescibacteria group bacterium]|nr:ferredoxin [Patescibacteria group bacterium]